MNKKQIEVLDALVIGEAKKLKANATPNELSKLDFLELNPCRQDRCIYGQMTGDCFNERAKTLIVESCERVFKTNDGLFTGSKLNGAPKKETRNEYWSPIELFIYENRNTTSGIAKVKKLVKFLKGENKTLRFKE